MRMFPQAPPLHLYMKRNHKIFIFSNLILIADSVAVYGWMYMRNF